MINNISKNKQRGFTIMELLVAVFVFSLIAMIITGIFIRAMLIQRRITSAQAIQDNVVAVLSLMTKEIRVGTITSANSNCAATSLSLNVLNPSGVSENVTYRLNAGTGIVERQVGATTYYISSNDVAFNSLVFCILNSDIDDQTSRVTVLASVSNRTGQISNVKIQSTLTSRDNMLELQN